MSELSRPAKKLLILSPFVLSLLVIVGFWWTGSSSLLTTSFSSACICLGRLSGLLLVYTIMVQFLLMGRTAWIEKTFGLDKLSQLHAVNGFATLIFLVLHPTLLIIGYASLTRSNVVEQFLTFMTTYEGVFLASVAFLLLIVVILLSMSIVRKRLNYEFWYFAHLFTYLAVILAWGHQLAVGEDFGTRHVFVVFWYFLYTAVFGNFIFFRFLKPLYQSFTQQFVIENIVKENDQVLSLLIGGKKLERLHIQAGQFVMVRFLAKNLWWESHPFSVSKLPDGKNFRISIKQLGDFTRKLTRLSIGTTVIVEGPFGIFTPAEISQPKVLCIAGGIGITPIRALVEHCTQAKKNTVLLYSNSLPSEIVFQEELAQLAAHSSFTVHYVISQDPKYAGEKGRIDQRKIFKLVPDFKERDIYICGPWPMTKALISLLTALGVPRQQLHFEKFALG